MSTDRELLKLAAKAAGIADGDVFYDMERDKVWNPRDDDGDRYRLAKKLKMSLDFDMCCVHSGLAIYQWGGLVTEAEAVLIAAAEIGKAMP